MNKRRFFINKGHACQQAGFSLIEALIVIGILAILGLILTTLLSRTIKGGNKTQVISTIKQNGQTALNIIDTTIRGADQVICIDQYQNPSDTIVILKKDIFTRIRFYPTSSTQTSPCFSVNGCIASDHPQVASPDELQGVNNICTQDQSNSTILTDTNQSSGVSVKSGGFARNLSPGSKDIVKIDFILSPANQAEPGNQVDFSTTVELR